MTVCQADRVDFESVDSDTWQYILKRKRGKSGDIFQIAELHKYACKPHSQCSIHNSYFAFLCVLNVVSIGDFLVICVSPLVKQMNPAPKLYL